jgi:hypothetical protein
LNLHTQSRCYDSEHNGILIYNVILDIRQCRATERQCSAKSAPPHRPPDRPSLSHLPTFVSFLCSIPYFLSCAHSHRRQNSSIAKPHRSGPTATSPRLQNLLKFRGMWLQATATLCFGYRLIEHIHVLFFTASPLSLTWIKREYCVNTGHDCSLLCLSKT